MRIVGEKVGRFGTIGGQNMEMNVLEIFGGTMYRSKWSGRDKLVNTWIKGYYVVELILHCSSRCIV